MTVILKPQLLLACNALDVPATCPETTPSGQTNWRGNIGTDPPFTDAQWAAWFASYTAMATHYAALVAPYQDTVKVFVVGTELPSTVLHHKEWAAVTATVRHALPGITTTFAAVDWKFTQRDWSTFDVIGVDAYFPLFPNTSVDGGCPQVGDFVTAWHTTGYYDALRNLTTAFNRPLMFTELGYSASAGCGTDPAHITSKALTPECQANAYTALYQVFCGEPWWKGVQWWSWRAQDQAEPLSRGLDFRGKPAEAVVTAGCAPFL